MAIVPEDAKIKEFYAELEIKEQLHPWVKENVVPHLILVPQSMNSFQQSLAQYLWELGECAIVADWPDDIKYFCESLIVGPGMSISLMHNIKFELDLGIKYESLVPHNALHDARAIRDYYLKKQEVTI